jgi:alkylhydroperoxidase family enzyme
MEVHTATAEQFGVPEGLLGQLIENPEQAPIEERMKALLAYVKKLTYTPSRLMRTDAEAVFVAGWNEQALHDAVSVCGLFNLMNRLVDGLGVTGDAAYFKLASARLASGGYSGLLKLFPE